MKCKEVKEYYKSGELKRHCFVDENGKKHGEYRDYYENGHLRWHYFTRNDYLYCEVKWLTDKGTLQSHCLMGSRGNKIARVIDKWIPATHSEEELIEIAKEHNLPLLSELPKAEAELTHWNLKHPTIPCLPISST